MHDILVTEQAGVRDQDTQVCPTWGNLPKTHGDTAADVHALGSDQTRLIQP